MWRIYKVILVSIVFAICTGCVALVDVEEDHDDDHTDTAGVIIIYPDR